jgi:hypothetical protein
MLADGAVGFVTTSICWFILHGLLLCLCIFSKKRGTRAFLTLLCFAGIWLVAAFVAFVVFFVREFIS